MRGLWLAGPEVFEVFALGVEPAEQCLTRGVNLVIDVHRRAPALLAGRDAVEPRSSSTALAHGDIQDRRVREFVAEPRAETLEPRGIDEVIFRDDDEIGLL